jgi:hypothetical protein
VWRNSSFPRELEEEIKEPRDVCRNAAFELLREMQVDLSHIRATPENAHKEYGDYSESRLSRYKNNAS